MNFGEGFGLDGNRSVSKYVNYILMFLMETWIMEMVRYQPSSRLRLCLGFCPSLTEELMLSLGLLGVGSDDLGWQSGDKNLHTELQWDWDQVTMTQDRSMYTHYLDRLTNSDRELTRMA